MTSLNTIAGSAGNAYWRKVLGRHVTVCLMMFALAGNLCLRAEAQCQGLTVSQPVTVDDETTNLPNSRQLVNGTNSVVDTGTAGEIKVDLSLPNSGVTAGSYTNTNMTVNAQGLVTAASNGSGGGGGTVTSVNPGTETTIGGTTSAPTVNVQFTTNSALTANTSLAVGNIYPCNTSSGTFQVLLPDATSSANKGAHIVVFLKTAGNALSVATTSSQLINGQSAPISVSNANTFLLFIADGTNWQCIPMQPAAGQTTNQWVAYIDALGAQHTAQIAFSNLGGSVSAAQMLALSSGQIYVGNSSSQPQATTPTAGTGLSVSAGSGSLQYSLSTPVSVANGGSGISTAPTSGQLLIGTSGGGYSVANLTAGSNVTITNSSGGITIASSGSGGGVSSVNAGTETTIGGTSSAPTVNVQFAVSSTLTANTTLAVGTMYPCNSSSSAFTLTLPDATASANKGAHIAVFLKTAGNALSIATTSSQLINGQSAPISVSNANTLLVFVADGTNWQCQPLQPATAQTSNQWVAYIDALGVQHTAQVAFSNLSGTATYAQMPNAAVMLGGGNASNNSPPTSGTFGPGIYQINGNWTTTGAITVTPPVRIYVNGTATISSGDTVTVSTEMVGGSTGNISGIPCPSGQGLGGGEGGVNNGSGFPSGGGGGGFGGTGGAGGQTNNGDGGLAGNKYSWLEMATGSGGGTGGPGAGVIALGGAGGGSLYIEASVAIDVNANVTANGAAGGSSSTNNVSGGGAGSGGFIGLHSPSTTIASGVSVTCTGGAGGSSTGSTKGLGGGGGGGGIIDAPGATTTGATVTCGGGAAGTGSTNGNAGNSGLVNTSAGYYGHWGI